jgi:hypothetical protein
MLNNLKIYTIDELKLLPYKQDIEKHYQYILDKATAGYLYTTIEIHPLRNRIVIKNLEELFPDTLFTHTKVSDSTDTRGYIVYKVSWNKKKSYTEVYPFKLVRNLNNATTKHRN